MTACAGMGVEFLTVTRMERDLIGSFLETQHKKQMRKIMGVEEE